MVPDRSDPLVADLLERCEFPREGHHHVGVSGGPDSLALLALAVASDAEVTAHHVDHGLRPGSDREAALVRTVARRWGAAFEAHSVQVEDGPDLEARCRDARMAALPPGWLTGHTADDQAETVLLRLLRGTGPSGLAAMDRRTHPLLGLRRSETEALCAHLEVEPFEDPTNRDPRFTRNRVRHEVIPLLCEVAGRDVVPLLARTAKLAREQSEVVEHLAEDLDATDAAAVRSQATPVAAAALRRWWRTETDGLPPPDEAAMGRMLEVARGTRRGCDVSRHWRLVRTAGRLRLEHRPPRPAGDGPAAADDRADTR